MTLDVPTSNDRFDVFLSHYSEEAPIAERLQGFLQETFPGLRVFRSSDDGTSISTGDEGYSRILSALREAKVYVVLISRYSGGRPWVNFEVGFGKGREASVKPFLIRKTASSEVPPPLSELQLRELATPSSIEEIVTTVEQLTGKTRSEVECQSFALELKRLDGTLPPRELRIAPFVEKHSSNNFLLRFRVHYQGPRRIELDKVWAEVPAEAVFKQWSWGPVFGYLNSEWTKCNGVECLRREYLANTNPPPPSKQFQPLRPALHPAQQPMPLPELKFALDPDYKRVEEPVRCQLLAKDLQTEIYSFRLAEIEVLSP